MDEYQVVAITFALIGVIIGIILYQLSKIFNLGGLKRYSEMFIWEAGVTVLLALFLFVMIDRLNNFLFDISQEMFKTIGKDISGVNPKTPMAAARVVLNELINSCYLRTYGALLMVQALFESVGMSIASVGAENTNLPTASLAFGTIYISDLLKIMFFLVWSSMAMFKLMVFFSAYYPFLIMLGIILRAFEPTKSLGAYLISLGIGLYVVLPMSYNIGIVLNYNDLLCSLPKRIQSDDTLGMGYANAFDIGENSRSFVAVSSVISMFVSIFLLITNPSTLVSFIYSIMALSFIAPLIAFIFALSFVNISTTALGGRISEVGRGLFRLV
ncbi:MAG: hypothetical protein QXL02_00825 [Candidatus Anstonellales archaeon]